MARPKKIGLEYFPLDCQMDDKVEILEAVHGLEGFAVYVKLLQAIYQTETGELDMAVLFRWQTLAKQWSIPVENLRKTIDTMLEIALFDKAAFSEREVLTSTGIQKRISTVSGLRDKDRLRKTTETGGIPYGKQVENTWKSTQREKEKETTNVGGEEATATDLPALKAEKAKREQVVAAHTDPDDLQGVEESPLVKPDAFAAILKATGYPNLDAERYRLQIAAKSEGVRRTSSQWRSRIIEFVNNDYTAGKLLTYPVLTPNEIPGNWDTARQGAYTAPMGQGIPHPSSYLKPDFTPSC